MKNEEIAIYLENIIKNTPKIITPKINKILNQRKEFYTLKKYMDNFLDKNTKQRFFIMPGLRGIGKTTIIYQLYDYLLNERKIAKNRILFLNLDRIKDFNNFNIRDYIDYYLQEIQEGYPNLKEPVFIFVDESQYSNNWDLTGKIIFDEDENVFMIFTGFDALNLEASKESARRSLTQPIYPLNFNEYLYLKYNFKIRENSKKILNNLIWTGNINESKKLEKEIKNDIMNKLDIILTKEWNYYLKYGELPFGFNLNKEEIIQQTIDMKNRIIEKDLDLITSINTSNKLYVYKLINMLAIQKPGDISHNTIANTLNKSINNITNLISALEKTHLIFHIEPYGSSKKRTTKSWKYYFLSTQIRSCIYLNIGQATRNPNDFRGLISENLIASTLFKMSKGKYNIFYDSNKNGVDFILNNALGEIVPIEVGSGKKSLKQLKIAINKQNAPYGILISNRTEKITKEDNIINIPLTTFSMM